MEKEQKKQLKQELKKIDTNTLREGIGTNKEYLAIAENEFDSRKDKKISEYFIDWILGIAYMSPAFFVLGLMCLGAYPSYFNVNNEFINPTNSSFGLNATFETIKQVSINTTTILLENGAEHPTTFFWLFWLSVIIVFIYPTVRLIINLVKRR